MLSGVGEFIKKNRDDIILALGVILISLLSFAIGYLVAKYQEKQPLKFEEIGELFFEGMKLTAAFFRITIRSMDIPSSCV